MTRILNRLTVVAFLLTLSYVTTAAQDAKPVKLGIARMTHDHIAFILDRLKRNNTDLQLAGIWEPDNNLVDRYSKKYGLDQKLFYDDLGQMLDKVKPEAVVDFGSIYEHLKVVEACAPRGIHVMVEKPLAVDMDHAMKMKRLAEKYSIKLLTDFETSWYPSTLKAWQIVNDSNSLGLLRKVVVHDGHEGPKEIGCSREFLAWLTDPVLNGGGAIIDFGCYGANLMTYLTRGEEPVSVTAVTRHYKPSVYPKVDDDAAVIVTYKNSECIIEASWNWPFGRKDMEIYGDKGYIMADNRNDMRSRYHGAVADSRDKVTAKDVSVYEDPFSYFVDVIRGKVKPAAYEPYSIENNLLVVKILDAARKSARTGKMVHLK
ncbi:MAG TPA: Gfo/Idh/MocA family oxidoreductase [Bacteroidales bacterium]|nr:Gfo/Idh/MocA family oxidoreductase [Bacteroidales bacterium]